jgi:hypothetical protein
MVTIFIPLRSSYIDYNIYLLYTEIEVPQLNNQFDNMHPLHRTGSCGTSGGAY